MRLNLALQGGGVHGAFTWGVLDRLLGEDDLDVVWLSGTSAGAFNAVAVAHGLATETNAVLGRESAQKTLAAVWQAVERAGVPDLLRLNPFLMSFARAAPVPDLSGFLSPYDFNPLGFDPLRRLLLEHIDFEAIRRHQAIDLLIAATDIGTGRARIFRRHELTVEAVLASACLPTIHHAVTIDGRAYWDGGFSSNPDLLTIAAESPCRDTLLVQLNPVFKAGVPKSPREIEDRVNTLTFNLPLLRDIDALIAAQRTSNGLLLARDRRLARLKAHRLHLIEANRHTSGLAADSKVKPDQGVLKYLHTAGRNEARRWIERHRDDVGRKASVDLVARFEAAGATPFSAPEAGRAGPPPHDPGMREAAGSQDATPGGAAAHASGEARDRSAAATRRAAADAPAAPATKTTTANVAERAPAQGAPTKGSGSGAPPPRRQDGRSPR